MRTAREEREMAAREDALTRLEELERAKKIVVTWHPNHHVILLNPETHGKVEFFPTRGTVVRNGVKQFRRGLDHALKLIGVKAA